MISNANKFEVDRNLNRAVDENPIENQATIKIFGNAFIVNFFVNGLIAWLCFGSSGVIPVLGGTHSVLGDSALTSFLLPFIIFVIVSLQIRSQSTLANPSHSTDSTTQNWLARNRSIMSTGALLGAGGALVAATVTILIYINGIESIDTKGYLLGKAIYTGLLAGAVTLHAKKQKRCQVPFRLSSDAK